MTLRFRAGSCWLGLLVGVPAAYAMEGFDWGFSGGVAPLRLTAEGDRFVSAATCGDCHRAQYDDWYASRHRMAHSNAIYQAGFAAEPLAFCVNCHAPIDAQAREVLAARAWGQTLLSDAGTAALAAEGVTCATCHWRDGVVLARTVSGAAPHATREVPSLGEAEQCRGCHEFRTPEVRNGVLTLGEPMQTTWTEWTAYRNAGGTATCQDCHMRGGRHTFHGAHDRAALAAALSVERRDDVLALRSVNVGHAMPTGDLFRNYTVEVTADGQTWRVIHRIGRTFALDPDHDHRKVLVADTTIAPGEVREVPLPKTTRAWRVVYHYGSPNDERRGVLSEEALSAVIAGATLDSP